MSEKHRTRWHTDYIEALLDRDLKEIIHIKCREAMEELVKIMASWSSKYMDISAICSGLTIRRPTVETYINALKALYILESIPPWTKTDYDRVGKQSKIFMTDTGLMASILSWSEEQVLLDPDRIGKLMKTFAFVEIAAQIDSNDSEYKLYHYRDRTNREIDFIIERKDNSILGLEIKAGSTVNKSDFKHLEWFHNNLAKDKEFIGIVLYTGEYALPFGQDLWAIPFGMLWPD